MIIPLEVVIYDRRARDGTWCTKPYPNHPRGCPNFPKCMKERKDFKEYKGYNWYAVVTRFDLKTHAKRMYNNSIKRREEAIEKHSPKPPKAWTERQCRCVLYWQPKVRSRLRKKTEKFAIPLMGDIILDCPEANGVHVFDTMKWHGLTLEKPKPNKIHKIMLVGKIHSSLRKMNEDE